MPCVDYAHAIQIWPKAKRAMKKRKGSRGFPGPIHQQFNKHPIRQVIKESSDTYLQCCVPANINGSGRVVHGQRDYVGDDDGHDGSFKTPSIGPIAVNQFKPTPPVQCIQIGCGSVRVRDRVGIWIQWHLGMVRAHACGAVQCNIVQAYGKESMQAVEVKLTRDILASHRSTPSRRQGAATHRR